MLIETDNIYLVIYYLSIILVNKVGFGLCTHSPYMRTTDGLGILLTFQSNLDCTIVISPKGNQPSSECGILNVCMGSVMTKE